MVQKLNRGAGHRFLWPASRATAQTTKNDRLRYRGSLSLAILIIFTVTLLSLLDCGDKFPEIAALRDVQIIAEAQTEYLTQFGRYAATLAELGPAQGTGRIPAKLASGEVHGYLFTLTSTAGGYVVNAAPKTLGSTGRRTFYLDQTGVIHQSWGPKPATNASPEVK